MVLGPAALTMSFITSADSHPWHVRWPEVKYSSRGDLCTPLIIGRVLAVVMVTLLVVSWRSLATVCPPHI
jgi:hypothetical protein